jgi:hypothetical protein
MHCLTRNSACFYNNSHIHGSYVTDDEGQVTFEELPTFIGGFAGILAGTSN